MEISILLEAVGISGRPVVTRSMSGDSGARVRVVEIDGEHLLVVKTVREETGASRRDRLSAGGSTRIHEEAAGLSLIAATETVPVPEILACGVLGGTGILVLEHLSVAKDSAADDAAWVQLGRGLADLHLSPPPACPARFGLDHDNHLGGTSQDNRPEAEWHDFLMKRRVRPMIDRLQADRLIEEDEKSELDRLAEAIPDLLPANIRPGLVHGDLWSGNALVTKDRGVVVIDPAVVIADPLFEIGMMRLFGGFPRVCEESLLARLGEVGGPAMLEGAEARIEIGRINHLLNHWLLFGREYAAATMRAVARLMS